MNSQDAQAAQTSCTHVRVLLATWNGAQWLPEQLDSIASQQRVKVSIVASDDCSSDETAHLLSLRGASGDLHFLPTLPHRLGSANANFLRLIRDAALGDAEYVALADQDDRWLPDKLDRAVSTLETGGFDAYSSNVTAVWPGGRTLLIDKAQPQREADHLFESAGPGCTFVITRTRFEELRAWVTADFERLVRLKVHDWLIYAYAREHGWRWHIDARPSVLYRQHGGNEIGANRGLAAALARIRQIRSGRFRQNAVDIADAVGMSCDAARRLRRFDMSDRIWLVVHTHRLRRRLRDQMVLAALLLLMPGRPPR